jgi:hypothetical protein
MERDYMTATDTLPAVTDDPIHDQFDTRYADAAELSYPGYLGCNAERLETLTIRHRVNGDEAGQMVRDVEEQVRAELQAELHSAAATVGRGTLDRLSNDLQAAEQQQATAAADRVATEATLHRALFRSDIAAAEVAEQAIRDAKERHAVATRRAEMLKAALENETKMHRQQVAATVGRRVAELLAAAREERHEVTGKLLAVLDHCRGDVLRVNATLAALNDRNLIESLTSSGL